MVKFINKEQKVQNERVKWIISGLSYDDLTEWEQGYIESIEEQSDKGKILSKKKIEILERIYREKTK